MSELKVRFWGTRGSIPTPGRHTEKYGGNTTCLELTYGDQLIVIDAGSGIRVLSSTLMRSYTDRPIHAHLLFTHLHWDHIQGFPFFTPAYIKGNSLTIYGEERPEGGIRELLSGQMSGAYFPVPLSAMQANMAFVNTAPSFRLGPIQVRTMRLPHPGGCLGYRFEIDKSVFVLVTDSEFDQEVLNKDEVVANHLARRKFHPDLLEFLGGANMIVIDCQYADDEYQRKRGWGHNSVTAVADLAHQVQPGALLLFHHDPESTDDRVAHLTQEVCLRLDRLGSNNVLVTAARERMTLKVCHPMWPPPLDGRS